MQKSTRRAALSGLRDFSNEVLDYLNMRISEKVKDAA